MAFELDERSRARLEGVHPDLVRVVRRAAELSEVRFSVTEGLRTPDRQARLAPAATSRSMRSRHLTGHAVDLAARVDGRLRWDWPLYPRIARAMKQAARELGVAITWGGDWRRFPDGPHFQLSWRRYPA